MTLKEWYDIKAPSIFQVRNPGKTLVTRTKGTSEWVCLLIFVCAPPGRACRIWWPVSKQAAIVSCVGSFCTAIDADDWAGSPPFWCLYLVARIERRCQRGRVKWHLSAGQHRTQYLLCECCLFLSVFALCFSKVELILHGSTTVHWKLLQQYSFSLPYRAMHEASLKMTYSHLFETGVVLAVQNGTFQELRSPNSSDLFHVVSTCRDTTLVPPPPPPASMLTCFPYPPHPPVSSCLAGTAAADGRWLEQRSLRRGLRGVCSSSLSETSTTTRTW